MSKELQVKMCELKELTPDELLNAYIRVRDLNLSKRSMGVGEESSIYQTACYEEIMKRMTR